MKSKRIVLLLVLALLLSACNLPVINQGLPSGGPQAWIDAPLDGMRLPLQPYSLTLHSSDSQGIASMEISINGEVLASLSNPKPAQLLVYLTRVWEPNAPGRYVISTRAQNIAGIWSAEDFVTVEIEGIITPTFTPTTIITPTITPTMVITPTFTPTVPPVTLAFGEPILSTQAFEYQRDCFPNPGEVTIKVPVTNPPQGTSVIFFMRIKNLTTGEYTAWDPGQAMIAAGAGAYQVTIVSNNVPNVYSLSGASAEFQYQFVAIDPVGAILLKSQVYTNISLSPCH